MEPDDGTVPLDDTFAEVVEFHGRMYQKYALTNETYFSPVDERETARLEQMHRIFNQVFDNRLIFPPVASPRRVLDLGCGGGDWASAVAEELPRASVLGIDASPHMLPEDPPDNLELQVDDLNARFTFQSDRYDIAHSQMVAGGIHATRWESYIRDIFRVLKPDGWCQMVEIYFNAQSDNGRLTRDHALSKWSSNYLQGVQPYKNPRAPLQIANWMRNAGFTEVESKLLVLPMCGWSSSKFPVPR
uniref:Methyltransferase domain-containing protein n=2 Tax=Bionectria ochroleuca TaxID=29856 RepID=A0A0B7JM23_BIOOC